ncbi:hypothetical protein GCM10022416_49150 [Actinomadura keratinilytica]|uniref:Uncharacterized protein n=1 Tax=Actinomadura keratinilytica TaxID=547461 RepID=A0ABP7ZAJ3_9ACTN
MASPRPRCWLLLVMVLAGVIGAALLVTGVSPGLWQTAAASARVHVAAAPASPEPSPTTPTASLNSAPAETPGTVEPGKWVQDPGSPFDNIGTPRKKCGFADLACMAGDAVTGWFRDLGRVRWIMR